jgi:hypothetical protein
VICAAQEPVTVPRVRAHAYLYTGLESADTYLYPFVCFCGFSRRICIWRDVFVCLTVLNPIDRFDVFFFLRKAGIDAAEERRCRRTRT